MAEQVKVKKTSPRKVLSFTLNGAELLVYKDAIDAIHQTTPGDYAGAGISVKGKVFYVRDSYEDVKAAVFGGVD